MVLVMENKITCPMCNAEKMCLEEIQAAHRSHVWDISFGGAQGTTGAEGESPWAVTTAVTGLEGTIDETQKNHNERDNK